MDQVLQLKLLVLCSTHQNFQFRKHHLLTMQYPKILFLILLRIFSLKVEIVILPLKDLLGNITEKIKLEL